MAESRSFFHRGIHWTLREARSQALSTGATAVMPVIASILTGFSGFLTAIPLPYLCVSIAVVFAAVSIGMLRFHELLAQRSVTSKLIPVQPNLGLRRAEKDGGQTITGAQIGIIFQNSANFPIEYHIEKIFSSFEGRIRQGAATYDSRGAIVYPNNTATFWDSIIEITANPNIISEGSVQAVVIYGKPGRLDYKMSVSFKITTKLAPAENLHFEWRTIESTI
jgi:hypothetical protein